MNSARLRVTALILMLTVIGGCSFGFLSSKKRTTDVEVVFLFTGSNDGELAPCG